MNCTTKNLLLTSMAILFAATQLQAQTKIGGLPGTTNPNAYLQIGDSGTSVNKGLLLPRVTLQATNLPAPLAAHTAGMLVYNTATSASTVADSIAVSPGAYFNNGIKWQRVSSSANWFYMPVNLLPADTTDLAFNTSNSSFQVNLYNIYAQQFGTSTVSPSAGTLPIPAVGQLGFFVTYYDNAVMQNVSVSDAGVLTYQIVAGAVPTDATYVNVVFQMKTQ